MKPIIIRVFLRNSSVAYKKKKMIESKVKRNISWSDFINICVDQLFTRCDLTGIKQGPTDKYLSNYVFYDKKEKPTSNNEVENLDENVEVEKPLQKWQEEILANEKKEDNE